MSDEGEGFEVNLNNLRDPESQKFTIELNNAHLYLQEYQSKEFFLTLFKHFRTKISQEKGNQILYALARILSIKKHLHIFIRNNCVPALPISNKNWIKGSLEVLYVLVTRAPQSLDSTICANIKQLVPFCGKQCLILISLYAQNFDKIENPWPMLDLLFDCKDRFSEGDLVSQYVFLLSLLVRTYPDFRIGRGGPAWDTVCEILTRDFSTPPPLISTSDSPIRAPLPPPSERDIIRYRSDAYNAACGIADALKRDAKLPYEAIFEHIHEQELASSALSLMMFGDMDIEKFSNPDFISTLLVLSRRSQKASLILMKLAQHKEVAAFLTQDNRYTWMEKEMPNYIDTLRLFLVVFQTQPIRDIIANLESFYIFLNNMIQICREKNSSELLSIIGTIVRRLDLNEDIVRRLSESHFIADFFQAGEEIGENDEDHTNSQYSAILLANKIGLSVYTGELRPMCETLAEIIRANDEHLSSPALVTATHLAKYPRCAKKFIETRLPSIVKRLAKTSDDSRFKKQAVRFIEIMCSDT